MDHLEPLTSKNFLLYCAKHYDNRQAVSDQEFYDDLKRIKYIKKLLFRYRKTGELKHHLILNHIITLVNVFGPVATVRLIHLKLGQYLETIYPFLVYLNILPDAVYAIEGKQKFYTDQVVLDKEAIECLRTI